MYIAPRKYPVSRRKCSPQTGQSSFIHPSQPLRVEG
jgi:hypothetical protein